MVPIDAYSWKTLKIESIRHFRRGLAFLKLRIAFAHKVLNDFSKKNPSLKKRWISISLFKLRLYFW